MKEHTQTTGLRKWAGDDLVELQKEPLDALQALVKPFAPCILQGCVPSLNKDGKTYTVSPGFVALKGLIQEGVETPTEDVKIVRFEGLTDAAMPLHLGLECTIVNRVYADGGNKPVKYQYVAKVLDKNTGDDFCLTITENDDATPHLVDRMGITEKVDKVDGKGLSDRNFTQAFEDKLNGIAAGATKNIVDVGLNSLSTNSVQNKAVCAALSKKADSGHSHSEASTSAAGFMSAADKTKLEGIATGANNYTHPTTAGNKHIPAGGAAGQYLKYSAAGTAQWAKPTASEIGAATSSHTHTPATASADGFMSAGDKANLNNLCSFRVVGLYLFTDTDAEIGVSPYGITVTYTKDTSNKRYNITLTGVTTGKRYTFLPIQVAGHPVTFSNTYVTGIGGMISFRMEIYAAGSTNKIFSYGGFVLVEF